jgi:hypothetical protein
MLNLNLLVDDVQDPPARDNFREVQNFADTNPFLQGAWIHKEYVFTQAETSRKIPHGLSYTPRDFIVTFVSAGATFTINYDSIDATNINITVSAACTVRLLMGRFSGNG